MSNISLTSSMRTNLLSLQQISQKQDQTQLRLSTGLKVNSALDNPSSYFTAQSLSNRANDLNLLLDAMGQGIQTIQAASQGIEIAERMLSQMKAIAEQVSSNGSSASSAIGDKAYFIDKVGSNGAVVSTAKELQDAINSDKETICVYGNIDLGDISTTGGLQLKENQKLVGINYFGNFNDGMAFSSISATASAAKQNMIVISADNCLLSDLSINYENSIAQGSSYAIEIKGSGIVANIRNLNLKANFSTNEDNTKIRGGIVWNGATTNIGGNMNIEVSGTYGAGIAFHSNAIANILSDANINIKTSGNSGLGIYIDNKSICNIISGANVNIKTSGQSGYGILTINGSINNILAQANINIETTANSGHGIYTYSGATSNLSGNIYISTLGNNAYGIYNSFLSNNQTHILSSAKIYLNTPIGGCVNGYNDGSGNNIFTIDSGAKIAFEKNGNTKWYEVKKNYCDENSSTSAINYIAADDAETKLNVTATDSWENAKEIIEGGPKETKEEQITRSAYQAQFNNALTQYNSLVKDSSYKGINLLEEDTLKINFNEDKSSYLWIKGVNVTAQGLGIQAADWSTVSDTDKSLSQIMEAQSQLRSAASKLGNYYSIITERNQFTDKMINVLEEGADKLSLADMNEESANMLSLQTQEMLAIKSLSLASQSARSVLQLFVKRESASQEKDTKEKSSSDKKSEETDSLKN